MQTLLLDKTMFYGTVWSWKDVWEAFCCPFVAIRSISQHVQGGSENNTVRNLFLLKKKKSFASMHNMTFQNPAGNNCMLDRKCVLSWSWLCFLWSGRKGEEAVKFTSLRMWRQCNVRDDDDDCDDAAGSSRVSVIWDRMDLKEHIILWCSNANILPKAVKRFQCFWADDSLLFFSL